MYAYIKMVNKYYQENKEKPRKEACERYQNISEKEKEKMSQYHRDQNKYFWRRKTEKGWIYEKLLFST